MRKVAVVGVGETNFSGPQEKTSVELFSEAAMEAITESNLKPKDIQALFVGNALGDFSEGQGMVQAFAAENIGCFNVPANRYEGACASASMALRDAFMWVASGFYFALLAHLYSAKYGVPLDKLKEQMATVSVQSYRYGRFNPKAHLRKEVDVAAVLSSFMVSTPIQLHDCCPFSDGAAVVILASEEAARKLTGKPVYITGIGQASSGPLVSQYDYIPRLRAREISSGQAYDMASLTPQDIDVCELHDCFSIASLISAEGLGFFDFGTSGEAWVKGEADIGGKIAINPSGGLKSKGHPIGATGAGQVYEIVKQLRGEVEPERQVEGARTGMTDTLGGDGGTVVNLILQRGW